MPPPRILLIGYRGSGKSAVGRLVADALGWPFADSDDLIEQTAGKTIAAIFAAEGEAGFRDREAAALAELCAAENRVIATGGGAVLRPANRELLKAAGYVAWLTAPPDVLWARIQADPATAARRPNLTGGGPEEVANLLAVRAPLYRETAAAELPTEGRSPEEVAAAILAGWASCSSCR